MLGVTLTGTYNVDTTIPHAITSRFIKFPATGIYQVTLKLTINNNTTCKWNIYLIKNLTTIRGRYNEWVAPTSSDIVDRTIDSHVPIHTLSGTIKITNTVTDTLSILLFADSSSGEIWHIMQSYQLIIKKILPI
jgi:hypothetical protein